MRKILGLTIAALLVIGLVGGGTWAYFSDVETSTGNILTAGTLDLNLNAGNDDVQMLTAAIGTVEPGDTGSASVIIANNGSIDGELDIATSAITNDDNGTADPEDDQDTDTGTGDLGGQATMVIWIDADESTTFNAGDIELNSTGANAYDAGTNTTLEKETIDSFDSVSWDAAFATLNKAGGTNPAVTLRIDWEVPGATTDNRIMGDSASFDITFTLEQTS